MRMHRNTEKVLADSIGATDEITLVYFHYSVSYKYRGRFRAQNILFSLYPYISLAPEEVPLAALNSPLDLRSFIDSTDKAIVLMRTRARLNLVLIKGFVKLLGWGSLPC
ncbi:hypothetical protein V8G54_024930 [Vigna mungo]|uniref:Uncharacterized protein n=1 Tax=Vigna mungo TaxID=3915 RepID=A0AAQ3N6S5_VIGMU